MGIFGILWKKRGWCDMKVILSEEEIKTICLNYLNEKIGCLGYYFKYEDLIDSYEDSYELAVDFKEL